jgi:hypothetical protein
MHYGAIIGMHETFQLHKWYTFEAP